jgi:DHA2 family multidrug resistance protein
MPKKINPWLVAISVLLGTFIEVLDTSVANVSLPHIAGSLSATAEEATWVLTSYLVSNGIVLPMAAWLASRFGRKRYFMASIAVFTFSSVLCGAAPSLPFLVFFRILQGLGGGGLQPNSQAILFETFPPEKRGQAMAAYGIGIVLAPMLGPILGGWITDNYSWRWIFYINLPIGLLAILLVNLFVFDPPYLKKEKTPVDFLGFGFLTIGIGALQYVLDRGQEKDWFSSSLITHLAVVAAISLLFFFIWELLVPFPITDLSIFKDQTFTMSIILSVSLFMGLFGTLVILPLFLQILVGYSSLQAGLALFPRGFGTMLGMPLAGNLLKKRDGRILIILGVLGTAFSVYLLSFLNLQISYWNVFWPQFLQGLSMSFLFVPISTVGFAYIPREKMGNATSVSALIRNIGASVGIAVATTFLQRDSQIHQSYLSAHLTGSTILYQNASKGLARFLVTRGIAPASSHYLANAVIYTRLIQQASTLAYMDNFRFFALFFLPFLPLIFFMKKQPLERGDTPIGH